MIAVKWWETALRLHHDLDAAIFLGGENLVGFGRFFQSEAMGDDEGRVDLSALNSFHQRLHVFLNVGLPHLKSQAFGKRGSHWEFVQEAAVHSGDRYRPALAAGVNRLTKRMRAIGFQVNG